MGKRVETMRSVNDRNGLRRCGFQILRLKRKMFLISLLLHFLLLDKVSCHKLGEDVIAYFEAYLPPGSKCGQQKPITGWTVKYDRFRDDVSPGTAVDDTYFSSSTGKYTTPPRRSLSLLCCFSLQAGWRLRLHHHEEWKLLC